MRVTYNFLLFSSENALPQFPWVVYISPTFKKDIVKDKYLLCRWIFKEIVFELCFWAILVKMGNCKSLSLQHTGSRYNMSLVMVWVWISHVAPSFVELMTCAVFSHVKFYFCLSFLIEVDILPISWDSALK